MGDGGEEEGDAGVGGVVVVGCPPGGFGVAGLVVGLAGDGVGGSGYAVGGGEEVDGVA